MKRNRILAAFMAAVMGVMGAVTLATPAHAGTAIEKYRAVSSYGNHFQYWWWVDEMEGIIGCIWCMHVVEFDFSNPLYAENEAQVYTEIGNGLTALSEASVASSPRTAAALRERAMAHFTAATRALDGARIRAGAAGYFDPERGTTTRTSNVWLSAAMADIADGLGLLQQGSGNPSPQPWLVAAAAAQFDEAFAEISSKRAIGA